MSEDGQDTVAVVPKKWDWKEVSENYKIEDTGQLTRSILRDLISRQNDIIGFLQYLIGIGNNNSQNFRNLYESIGALEKHMSGVMVSLEPKKKPWLSDCQKCGADNNDLKVETLLIQTKGEYGSPDGREFVYCRHCGHYGDLDTWNDRA